MIETLNNKEKDALRLYIAKINPLMTDSPNINSFIRELLTIFPDFKFNTTEYVLNKIELEELKIKYLDNYQELINKGEELYNEAKEEKDTKIKSLNFNQNFNLANSILELIKPNERLVISIKKKLVDHFIEGDAEPKEDLVIVREYKLNKERIKEAMMLMYLNNLYKDELISNLEYIKLKQKLKKGS